MTVDLIEDSQARGWRFNQARIMCFKLIRTCLIYGPAPSIMTTAVLWIYFEQPIGQCLIALFVPLMLSIPFFLLPYQEKYFPQPRHRWRLTNQRLETGGFSSFKNISWIPIHSCSTRRLPELPGCYLLEVRGKDVRQAFDLVLSEATMTPAAAEALVAEHPTFRFI